MFLWCACFWTPEVELSSLYISVLLYTRCFSNYRGAWVQAEQDAAYYLEAGRVHQHVLRRGMYVTPASLDGRRGQCGVHSGRVRDQIDRLYRQLRSGDHGEPRVRAILDTEALAGLALAPDLVVATIK